MRGTDAAGWVFVAMIVLALVAPVLMLASCIVFGIAGAVAE